MEDKGISTKLLVPSGSVCFSYANAPWKLFLRKEVGTGVGPQASGAGRVVVGWMRSEPKSLVHPLSHEPFFQSWFSRLSLGGQG